MKDHLVALFDSLSLKQKKTVLKKIAALLQKRGWRYEDSAKAGRQGKR